MRRIIILSILFNFMCLNVIYLYGRVALPINKEVVVKEFYEKLGSNKIKGTIIVKFGDSGDWPSERSFLRVQSIGYTASENKELGKVDFGIVSLPLQIHRVRLKNVEEIAYLISMTGNRSKDVVVKITPEKTFLIFEEEGFNLLREEVLDIDGDGIDEIILYRGKDIKGKNNIKEIYKYKKDRFVKIKQIHDEVAEWLSNTW